MRSKCLCIKTYYNSNGTTAFLKNKWYKYTHKTFTTREYPEGFNVQFHKGEYLFFRENQDPLAEKGYGVFSTYFKTLKDIRKEKIEKIEKILKD